MTPIYYSIVIFLAFFLILATLVTQSNGADDKTCESTRLAHCQTVFNNYLGIAGDADWHNPKLLQSGLFGVYSKDVKGLLKVCSAYTDLYQCLGNEYFKCINRLYFASTHYNMENAYEYIGTIKSLHFMCVGGLQVSVGVSNWQCISDRFTKDGKTLVACQEAFNTSRHNNPHQICNSANTFLQCYSKPFNDNCKDNGESAWWSCELLRSAMSLDHWCPSLRCPVNGKHITDLLLGQRYGVLKNLVDQVRLKNEK